MAVYFSSSLVQLFEKTARLPSSDYDLMKVDVHVQESVFTHWRDDLSINVANSEGPILTREDSDEIALVLVAKYYGNDFLRDMILVPDGQFVNCVRYIRRIKDENGKMYDVAIVFANPGDVFCITSTVNDCFYIVCKDQVLERKKPSYESLKNVANNYKHLFGNKLEDHLKKENFGFRMWREVMPDFR